MDKFRWFCPVWEFLRAFFASLPLSDSVKESKDYFSKKRVWTRRRSEYLLFFKLYDLQA